MRTRLIILVAALALAGCSHDTNGNDGNADMAGTGSGGGDVDMGAAGDLADTSAPPAPTATHVGATGPTSCLVTDGNGHAAYLLNAAPVTSGSTPVGIFGELHVVSADGTDVKVASNVYEHGYELAPDGKSIFWVGFDPTNGPKNGTASLNYLSLGSAGATPKTIVSSGMPVTNASAGNPLGGALYTPNPLTQESFYSPSGKYFLVAIAAALDSTTPDLHVIDTQSGADVYQRPNGGAVYTQLVLPDDTMIFQDTAGGTSAGTPVTPVQTLYWVTLPGSSAATAITTHTAEFRPTADLKTLVILKSGGDLLTWDLTNKSAAPKTLATGAALFTIGAAADGPVAYVGGDGSVHVVALDGTKKLDLDAATAAGDVFGTVALSPSGGDVYWWRNVEQQNNRGTLYHAAVHSGATPAKVADKVSLPDLTVTDSALVFLQNVDDLGKTGDAATAALDGSNVTALGTKAVVGGLRVANPGPQTWFGLHLTGAAADATNAPIDGSPAYTGALAFATGGAAEVTLDATVHAGAYALADDGRAAAFATGATWNATAKNWVGTLSFVATRDPGTAIAGNVSGVSELGPIVGRKLFVNAPGASPAGVYFVTY